MNESADNSKNITNNAESSHMEYELKLGESLRRLMASTNENSHSLSKKLGIAHSSLSDWLSDRYPQAKSMPIIMKLANHFGVPLHELLFNIKDSQSDAKVLFTSEFRDEGKVYKISVESKKE